MARVTSQVPAAVHILIDTDTDTGECCMGVWGYVASARYTAKWKTKSKSASRFGSFGAATQVTGKLFHKHKLTDTNYKLANAASKRVSDTAIKRE